jgi:uncharacterized membrane protein
MSFFSSLPKIDHDRVTAAIVAAEAKTSGEIRVVLSRKKAEDALTAAQIEFDRLGMQRTAARNGVLIFLAPSSQTFAVVGDQGVHEKCGQAFWQELAQAMSGHFQRGDFTAGLVDGVDRAGALLGAHFPRHPDDRNELPDQIEEVG